MSSSEDDVPLVNGSRSHQQSNGIIRSKAKITQAEDHDMSDAPSSSMIPPGISLQNGPIEEMEVDEVPYTNGVNGTAKRKQRSSVSKPKYTDTFGSSSEDEAPLAKKRRTSNGKVVKKKSKDESDFSDSDVPLVAKKTSGRKKSTSPTTVMKKPPKFNETALGESSDSDTPLGAKLAKEKQKIEKQAEKAAKEIRKEEQQKKAKAKATPKKKPAADDSDSDVPKPKAKAQKKATPASKKANGTKKDDSSDDEPIMKKTPSKKAAGTPSATPKKAKKATNGTKEMNEADLEEGEELDEEYRWWEQAQNDGTQKWTTLEHNGVLFPPPYEPLPKKVKMKYNGIPVTMEPEAEEIAGFFGAMLNSTHNVENPKFQANFFKDFQDVLKKTGGAHGPDGQKVDVKEFKKCDFLAIFDHFTAQRDAKKALPAADKKKATADKKEAEAPYQHCTLDGRREKIGNFKIEPPGLFRGRGDHPKTGKVKARIQPEQVTINIGEDAEVPPPPPGHNWKEVIHNNTVTWLATWTENVNGNIKYVMLAANSSLKGMSDFKKFEKARELKKHIDRIRKDYKRDMKAELMADRQRATAMYLIDEFALRAGNEKGEDEADTVGCCSLKFEHLTLIPPNTVQFDFLGKDSIRFFQTVAVDPQAFKNLKIFKKAPKKAGDTIFDRLTTTQLNKHLQSYMTGLTAKVFRTYNASWTMARLLKELEEKGEVTGNVHEKIKSYNDANRKVAILCNHQRTVGAAHGAQMEKLGDKIKGLMYQQWRIKQMMLTDDPKLKKKKGAAYFDLPEELDEDWIKEHQEWLVQQEREKIQKKFAKENEKLAAAGEPQLKEKDLKDRLGAADVLQAKFKKENKTKKVVSEVKNPENAIEKLDQRIDVLKVQAEDRENNKEVALGTSKINYIDPRLSVVFCNKFDVPIEKIFSKTLREKFKWAIESVDEEWDF